MRDILIFLNIVTIYSNSIVNKFIIKIFYPQIILKFFQSLYSYIELFISLYMPILHNLFVLPLSCISIEPKYIMSFSAVYSIQKINLNVYLQLANRNHTNTLYLAKLS